MNFEVTLNQCFLKQDSDDEQPADSFDGESENIQARDLSNDWWYDDDDAALDTAKGIFHQQFCLRWNEIVVLRFTFNYHKIFALQQGLKPLPADDRTSQSSSPVSEKAPNRIPAEGYAHSSRSSTKFLASFVIYAGHDGSKNVIIVIKM